MDPRRPAQPSTRSASFGASCASATSQIVGSLSPLDERDFGRRRHPRERRRRRGVRPGRRRRHQGQHRGRPPRGQRGRRRDPGQRGSGRRHRRHRPHVLERRVDGRRRPDRQPGRRRRRRTTRCRAATASARVAAADDDVVIGDNATVDRVRGTLPAPRNAELDRLPFNGTWGETTWNEPNILRVIRLLDVSTDGGRDPGDERHERKRHDQRRGQRRRPLRRRRQRHDHR